MPGDAVDQSLILIPDNRQRREHDADAHQDLITSILSIGLLQPIVLRGMTLVAGERRLRALREIYDMGDTFRFGGKEFPAGVIPYTDLGDLSPLEAQEAELEENIRRVDLTWQERVSAEQRLFDLRAAQAVAKNEPVPSLREVASEITGKDSNAAASDLRQSVVLARNLHRPEVAGAKTVKEALKALTRTEETERNVELAAALGKDFLGEKHAVFNADCLAWMEGQNAGTYDIILTDPPYGMGADEFGDSGGATQGAHFYEDTPDRMQYLLGEMFPRLFAITKPDAHLYLFCDIDQFMWLKVEAHKAGWTPFRTPLIWVKPSAFRAPWPDQGPQRKYECILYAVKGDLKVTKMAGDVLTYPPDVNLGHNAQKPVALYQDLLSRSLRPGMKVLDPFCGTGPIFPAAHALSGIATGIEQDPAAYAIAASRIQKLKGKA